MAALPDTTCPPWGRAAAGPAKRSPARAADRVRLRALWGGDITEASEQLQCRSEETRPALTHQAVEDYRREGITPRLDKIRRLEPLHCQKVDVVVETVRWRGASDDVVHGFGVLELEEEVVGNGELRPHARAGNRLALRLPFLGVDQVGAAVIDEGVALKDVSPRLAQERRLVTEAGCVPPEFAGESVASIT